MGLRPRCNRLFGLLAVLCALSGLLATSLCAGELPDLAPEELAVIHLDIGQGTATLVVGPQKADGTRTLVLIDAGATKQFGGVDGGKVVLEALQDCGRCYGTQGLDYFVATHYHEDHVGGAVATNKDSRGFLLGPNGVPGGDGDDDGDGKANWLKASKTKYQPDLDELGVGDDVCVEHFVDIGKGPGGWCKPYEAFVDQLTSGISPGTAKRESIGRSTPLDEGNISLGAHGAQKAMMLCVAAGGRVRTTNGGARTPSGVNKQEANNTSIGYLLNYEGFDYLVLGDAENALEMAAAAYLAFGTGDALVDVLNVSHHESKKSSKPVFLTTINPTLAVISVGDKASKKLKGYKLPKYATLKNLDDAHVTAVYETGAGYTKDIPSGKKLPAIVKPACGRVVVTTNGEQYRVWLWDAADGQLEAKGPYEVDGPCPALAE